MNKTELNPFVSVEDALRYVGLTSGLEINKTLLLPRSQSKWQPTRSLLPLILGFVGLVFNILALFTFTASKTFRQNSFRYYIYALALINCLSVLRHLQYFQQSTATASLWIMVLLSLERSLTFSRPFAVKKLSQTRIICIILLLLTCLCFALHIDELISADIKGFRWENFAYGICSVKRHFYLLAKHIEIVAHANSFILPFLLNSILDVYICYKICQRRKRLSIKSTLLSLNTRDRKKVTRSKRSIAHEITLTLLCQSLWLLLSYFPIHLYYLGISFKSINVHDRENPTFNLFMRQNLLIYLTFSPTLYVIISPTLRKEICSYICQSNNRHRSISLSTYSYTQRKYPNLLNDHCHHLQQPNNEQVIIPLLNNISEQTPEMILSNSIYIPLKIQCASKSEPCLLVHNHEDQCGQNQKMERSNTLQK